MAEGDGRVGMGGVETEGCWSVYDDVELTTSYCG